MKTIGIKLADGSFYPIMEEGAAQTKTLELTTANNNQTCVMVDLYSSETGTLEGAEYIDTLKIDNLNAHPNGELNISFSIAQDEEGKLSTNIVDKETGTNAESVSSLSHIFRNSDELANPDNFTISNLDRAKFPTVENAFNPDAQEEFDLDAPLTDNFDSLDSLSEEPFAGDTTLTMDEMPDTNGAETIDAPFDALSGDETISEDSLSDDIFADLPTDDAITKNASDDVFADLPTDEAITENTSDDVFADLPTDETITENTSDDVLADLPTDESITENASDDVLADLPTDNAITKNASDDVLADLPTDESITENASDDVFADLPTDNAITKNASDDVLADLPTDETITENTSDDVFADLPTDEAFSDNFEMDSPAEITDEEKVSDDIFSDIPDNDEISDEDIPDEISIPKDEPSIFDDDFSQPQAEEINKANGPISFSGLYDKETELGESSVHEESKKKTTIPMLICIICAIICVIATLILLISAPAKAMGKKQKTKTEQIVKEETVQTNETVDSVIVIENADSVTPAVPTPKKNSEKVTYKIKWGDTLWDISNNFYKNPWKFTRIAKYNKITNPDYIISGTVITIPAE